jgi:hypothetical protein
VSKEGQSSQHPARGRIGTAWQGYVRPAPCRFVGYAECVCRKTFFQDIYTVRIVRLLVQWHLTGHRRGREVKSHDQDYMSPPSQNVPGKRKQMHGNPTFMINTGAVYNKCTQYQLGSLVHCDWLSIRLLSDRSLECAPNVQLHRQAVSVSVLSVIEHLGSTAVKLE